jgi:hypothetical protein
MDLGDGIDLGKLGAASFASTALVDPASQQPRCSVPSSGRRWRSSPQYPICAATERRKCRQVEQVVEDRRQTQHRAVSAWGVPQWGHRHIGMDRW